MFKINTKVFYQENDDTNYIILGSKTSPYKIKISETTAYFVYPPFGFDYIIGEEAVKDHHISDIVYAQHHDVKIIS